MSLEILESTDEGFYSNAVNYWSEIPATLDGMLGGFGHISLTDIKGSKMLLKQLFNSKDPPGRHYALDCGAGIGRISKFLLTEVFDKVDMVEQNETFLEQAKHYLGPKVSKVPNFYPVGLQHFEPEPEKYDVIWIQWVIGHLTNKDLIHFLKSCRQGLKKNGVIVLKENVTSTDEIEKDEQDSSVTRPMYLFHQLFQKSHLSCYRQTKQQNFPKGLFSVYMFVLKPVEDYLNDVSIEQGDKSDDGTKVENNTPIEDSTTVECDAKTVLNATSEDNAKNEDSVKSVNYANSDCDKLQEQNEDLLCES